ncbi:MAG: T9SS type A sorting domain-containing protein [Bacteroidia bacterium]|nr:T9SS type A sorting domain-containing protein [Bacteroidia bacterium]
MKQKFTLLILTLFISSVSSFAQISEGGIPIGISNGYASQLDYIRMPEFDLQQLRNEDAINDQSKGPFRFGYNHIVNYNLQNTGASFLMPDGGRLWLLGVRSIGALSINLAFNDFYLPEGAKMFIYNVQKNFVLGAFTQRNNDQSGFFATDLIPGEAVVIEYYEPLAVANEGHFNLFRVTHGYRGVEDYVVKSFGDAGSCQVNVNCPLGTNWQSEKQGVVCLVVGGGEFCTGSLVNNVPQDGKPYVLTANHCSYSNDWASWVFRFNWEAPGCSNPGSNPSSLSLNTSVLRARNGGSDFCLVEITGGLQGGTVPSSFNTFFNGWSNVNTPATSAVCIHHPSGDIKKISEALNSTISSTFSGADCWRVGQWTTACTEPGSSGSPLFDQNHRIVGQLYGGPSACGQSAGNMNDYYGKFFTSWNTGTTAATRLRDWLDPGNTGVTTLNGFDPNNVPVALDANVLQILSPASGSYCIPSITPSFILKNRGLNTLTSVTVNWKFNNNPTNTFAWTGNLITNATATVTLPVISVAAGVHTYSVRTSLPNGSADLNTTNDSAGVSFTIVSATPLVNLPVNEGFEAATFPPTNWTRINPDNSTTYRWNRTTSVSGFGTSTACIMMDNFNYSSGNGQSDIMQTPYINFSSAVSPLRIYMDVAFAFYSATYADSLIVSYSTDCGLTWTRVYANGRAALATNGGNPTTTAFTPTTTQWRKDSININSLAGQPAVLFAFENISGWGNNLYLDNINIMQAILTGVLKTNADNSNVSIYPNPSDGNINILLDNSYSGDVNVALFDAIGQKIYSELFADGKNNTIEKNFTALSKGIYFLHISQGNTKVVRKIVLTK